MNYLIVGLGNIGEKYKNTRHNIGFKIVDFFSKKWELKFKKQIKLKSEIAKGKVENKKVYLLKPSTYVNNSGIALKACKDFFKIEISNILVIVDDVYIPFGEFRLKKSGSSGGHKGLMSIEINLNTQTYNRLKVGIGNAESEELSSYVLKDFSKDEEKNICKIINRALDIIYLWLQYGIDIAMNKANIRKKKG
ncbi:MAG: hypothetical protein AMS24_05055 [Chlamydiae bacterium SM23_39]|nr:MAG: hypothetical protein AMS24_05055 [Chlamydiae bacterium SM23_39]